MGDSPEDVSPSSDWPRRRSVFGRRRPRSISGVDGPTSRLPSSSVASIANINFAARRSTKETCSSAPVSPNTFIDPPRPAREGYEWVWFPAGYWAEREIVETPSKVMKHFKWRKRSGKSSSGKDTQDDLDHSPNNPWAQTPQHSPFLSEEAHVQSLQSPSLHRKGTSSESGGYMFPRNRTLQALQTPLPSPYLTEEAHVQSLQRSPLGFDYHSCDSPTPLPDPTPKPMQSSLLTITKGDSDFATPLATPLDQPPSTAAASLSSFFHLPPTTPEEKPKKSLIARLLPDHKSKHHKTDSSNDASVYEYTKSTIEGTRAQLLGHRQTQSPMRRVASLLREETKGGGGGGGGWTRKLFGKSPWHRKPSDASASSSVASSVRDVLRGRTPFTSPVSHAEPISSFCVQFPGGEAKRVKTPPLRESGNPAGRPRSFFFDIATPPIDDNNNNSSGGSSSSSSSSEQTESRRPPPRVPYAAGRQSEQEKDKGREKRDSGKEWWEVPVAVPRYEAITPNPFEFDLPEHLPNSPMCPANKRHKSGGTGVCVYHGRRKRSEILADIKDKSSDEDVEKDVWT
ncbi:hypothetical protein F4804DRAFT_333633 [Jackrogersella minutella]|nr:hypothetical protein F4804DRAFT_333633 [Jackrogersella minutella]